jgi:hypothetical protein
MEHCSVNTDRRTEELEEKPVLFLYQDKAVPLQAHYRPCGFQEFQAPIFRDSPHVKLARLSGLCTSHLYP